MIRIDGIAYQEHRVVFALSTGEDPGRSHVDHRTGKANAASNLQACTNAQNIAKRTRKNRNNTSGVHGVIWHRGAQKWMAALKFHGEKIYLGLYQDLAEAAEARRQAEAFFFGAFPPTILNEHG